ncbi:hypothetical protein FORC13_p184 (plasmid) [Bacillus cereus]|nr:hypothetical protein FORC13_p184 [Bacillus cereus]
MFHVLYALEKEKNYIYPLIHKGLRLFLMYSKVKDMAKMFQDSLEFFWYKQGKTIGVYGFMGC